MSKARLNFLSSRPIEEEQALIKWLFDDRPPLTYDQACARYLKEFGQEASEKKLIGLRERVEWDRKFKPIVSSQRTANEVIAEFEKNPADTFKALLYKIGQFAFDQSMKGKLNARNLAHFTKLFLSAKKEERGGAQLQLNFRKFEFKGAKEAIKHAAEIKEIAANDDLDDDAKIEAVRLRLWGSAPK